MWQILAVAFVGKIVFNRGKKALQNYRALRDLKAYGKSMDLPYLQGEDVSSYREKLIKLRDKRLGR